MNKCIVFIISISFSLISLYTFSQDNPDSLKLLERSKTYLNYENYRSSITDTTLISLKKLLSLQTDLIQIDNQIIRNFISSNSRKVEELQKKISITEAEKTTVKNELVEKNRLLFYGLIAGAAFLLLTILFIILFIITNRNKKKALSQLIKIEKIKEEQLKEIGLLKNEIAGSLISSKNELQSVQTVLENELKLQKEKYDDINREKQLLENKLRENKLRENEKSLNELALKQSSEPNNDQTEITILKQSHDVQVQQLNEDINHLKITISSLSENIQQKEDLLKNKCSEYDSLKHQLTECRDLLEKEAQSILTSEEKISEHTENITGYSAEAYKKLETEKAILESELNIGKEELNKIQTELANSKNQLQNEYQLRIEIENEIKQIIEEIKEMRK